MSECVKFQNPKNQYNPSEPERILGLGVTELTQIGDSNEWAVIFYLGTKSERKANIIAKSLVKDLNGCD